VPTAGSCPVPGYLPAVARPVLPWARRHVARVARRYHTGIDDLWDETIAALLRAAIYYDAASGPFAGYAHTAVHRACWRYVCRQIAKRPLLLVIASVDRDVGTGDDAAQPRQHGVRHLRDDYVDLDLELASPSAEDEVLARDAARRAWLLREHATLAAAHGDPDTATRLRDAATEAATVARAARRRSAARP
jgi:Sigma-70 region 2